MNSFTIARTPKLVFNETGKIKNMQISILVLYMHVLYMYIMHCVIAMGKQIFLVRSALLRDAAP